MDTTLMECLRWEKDHGYITEEDFTRLLTEDPPGRVVTLQEGREQPPTSYGKEPPKTDPEGIDTLHARLAAAIQGRPFHTLAELRAQHHARPPKPAPAPRPLTEVQLTEARDQLYAAGRGEPLVPLPEGIHARLYRAITR